MQKFNNHVATHVPVCLGKLSSCYEHDVYIDVDWFLVLFFALPGLHSLLAYLD